MAMTMCRSCFTFVVFLLSVSTSSGLEACMTGSGLSAMAKGALPLVQANTDVGNVGEVRGNVDIDWAGNVDYTLSDVDIYELKFHNLGISPNDNGVLVLESHGNECGLTADWSYRKTSWPHLHDRGQVDVAFQLDFDFQAEITHSHSGRIAAEVVHLNVDFHGFDIHLDGGASWFYNLFQDLIENEVKDVITDAMKDQLQYTIQTELDHYMQDMPVLYKLNSQIEFDVSLLQDPEITSRSIISEHRGVFLQHDVDPDQYPARENIVRSDAHGHMLEVGFGQPMIDSLFAAFQKGGYFQGEIGGDFIEGYEEYFSLAAYTSPFPEMGTFEQYADLPVSVYASAVDIAAVSSISSNGIEMSGPVAIKLLGESKGEKLTLTGVCCHVEATTKIVPSDVGLAAEFSKMECAQIKPIEECHNSHNTGSIDEMVLGLDDKSAGELINQVLNLAVMPAVNDALVQASLPINDLGELQFFDADVVHGDGFVTISGDIKFEPNVDHHVHSLSMMRGEKQASHKDRSSNVAVARHRVIEGTEEEPLVRVKSE